VKALYENLFNFLAKNRLEKGDLDRFSIHLHLVVVATTGLLMWAYAIIGLMSFDSPIPAIVGFTASIIHLLSPLVFRFSNNKILALWLVVAPGFIHQSTFAYFSGGFDSQIIIWISIIPLIAGVLGGLKQALLWFVIAISESIVFVTLEYHGYTFPNLISEPGRYIAFTLIQMGYIFLNTIILGGYIILQNQHKKEMQSKNDLVNTLFRVLIHDLSNPLAVAKSSFSVLGKKNSLDERLAKSIDRSLQSMFDITIGMRALFYEEKTKGELHDFEEYSLNEAIEYLEMVFEDKLNSKEIRINYDPEKTQALKILVDPTTFNNQVLANIISNAIKFSNEKTTIDFHAEKKGSKIKITIKDYGVGIPAKLLEHLFDSKKNATRIGTQGERGTGFGMPIVKRFVEINNGTIEVTSICKQEDKENHGTEFTMTFNAV
jgi:signal transduction histidine kinase